MLRRLALVTVLALLASGCGAVTGRSGAAWTDDKTLLGRVKAAIVGVRLRNLTQVDVDVYDRVVYLCGTLPDSQAKQLTESAARGVDGVREVVSHLVVRELAASGAALPGSVLSRPAPPVLRGVVRLEDHRAYDAAGRVVATVYIIPMAELAQAPSDRFTAERPIDHVTVHAMEAEPDVPVPHYLFVLWYAPEVASPR